MEYNLRDFFIPPLFISLVIGYQIFIYFLYQYYKAKNKKLEFTEILLAYGLIFGLMLTGFFIRLLNLYYIREINIEIFYFLTKITFLLLYSALMLFFIIVSTKSFQRIINSNFTKILAILIIIPMITVFIFQPDNLIFGLISGITLAISYTYIFFFHTRLIKISTGDIKKRLNLILLGLALCGIQHFIGGYFPSEVLFKGYSQILQLISAPIFVSGLIIVFLGVYRFPAFLEFGWKESLLYVFIINQRNLKVIYTFDFKEIINERGKMINNISNIDEIKQLFSSGIIGINKIISGITNSKLDFIESIRQKDFIILLNRGEEPQSFIIYCLLVRKDMNSLRYFLKTIKNEFEQIYRNILINLNDIEGKEEKIFLNFDEIMKKLIV